jgi:hypothetical protein
VLVLERSDRRRVGRRRLGPGALVIVLQPLQSTLAAAALLRLMRALMFLCGSEALIVARDALDLDEKAAVEVMCWSARAIVKTAIEEAGR